MASIINIEDVAFVGFRAPDLQRMRGFLEDFGATLAAQDDTRLFMRGCESAPFVHVTELGEPGFAALGLRAASVEDLLELARSEGLAPKPLDAPGGGQFIELTDPDGFCIRVVAGQQSADALSRPNSTDWNSAMRKPRVNLPKRVAPEAVSIVRLGHCVLNVSDFRASEAWYKSRFGFVTSDEIEVQPGVAVGAFLRCNRGDQPADHHTLALVQLPSGPGFNHAAFEVRDIEDLLAGHARLIARRHEPAWGIGRHYLGSQVFDYWLDPWGHMVEHWTDGDVFTAADAPRKATFQEAVGTQWGPAMPERFLASSG